MPPLSQGHLRENKKRRFNISELEQKGEAVMELDTRSYYVPEDLQIRLEDDSDGVFSGYAVVWDVLDSHGTRFKKGAFKKTLTERGDKIKILFNHDMDEPIGKPVEMREDDIGLYVRGQLTAGVKRADETRLNIQAAVIDALSIGFNTIQDVAAGQYRDITEVKLYEFSPVTFPSNEAAKITDYRSEDLSIAEPDNKPIVKPDTPEGSRETEGDPEDTRDVDFNESFKQEELYSREDTLIWALRETLWDIWWMTESGEEAIPLLDTALAEFHSQYLEWAREYIGEFWDKRHAVMSKTELGAVTNVELRKLKETAETLAAKTHLTAEDIRTLSKGKLLPFESRGRLAELPAPILEAHQRKRLEVLEGLCDELRSGGFGDAEKRRFAALLGIVNPIEDSEQDFDMDSVSTGLDEMRDEILS